MTADVLEPQHAHALRPGVILADRFRLVRSLRGTSSFAFSYQAEDLTTGESVVVKEFFPRSLVSRAADGLSVRAHSPECERDFLRALHRYALEGAVLAESTHPNLVRVRAVVDANATVYLVMNRHESQPLADYLRAAGGRVASAEAGRIVQHLLSALQVLHTESIIHRDLSPRSVHVGADGSAILLEFSARRHLPMHATDLAAGFAAFEQYGMRDIGPWTDVYAVSALLYYMLTGAVPPSALDRAAGETVVSPMASIPGVAPGLARLALKGMALLPQQRPHAVSELRRLLDGALAEAVAATARNAPTPVQAEVSTAEIAPPSLDDAIVSDYDRAAPLRLAAGGIVVPGEERGVRLLRMLGDAASRLRRSMTPNQRPAGEPAAAPQDAPFARAVREIEPEPAPVIERTAVVVPAPSFSPPPLAPLAETPRSLAEEQTRGLDLAAELALATDVMQSSTQERENSRRRVSIAAVAALVVVVGGSLALLARSSRASSIKPTEQTAPAASNGAVLSAVSGAGDPHVSVESGAVQQSTSHAAATPSRTESDSPVAKHAPAVVRPTPAAAASNSDNAPAREPVLSARMPNLKIAVAAGTAPDIKIVPPEVLVESRTRLTNGEDQVEQGEYVTARRTFRSAILQLDSVAMRFPESQSIKSLKRDLEQADSRAVQACAAENDMRKRRGEQARACQ